MTPRHYFLGLALASAMLAPAVGGAQGAWKVTVIAPADPVPAGMCAAVRLRVVDVFRKETPRSPTGYLVTLGDFDMSVSTPDGVSAVGQQNGIANWSACACQGAAVGTVATVTATYPAQNLTPAQRVPGVAVQQSATFTIGASKGTDNPADCPPVAAQTLASNPTPIGRGTARGRTPAAGPALPTVLPAGSARGTQPPVAASPVAAPVAVAEGVVRTTVEKPGRGESAPVLTPVAPVPVNPSGFTAVQTGPGQVQLTWQPVGGAAFYALFGPGSTGGGVEVPDATTFTVTGVPAGQNQWMVGTYVEPGRVRSPLETFTRVTLNVTAPAVATAPPAAAAPVTSRYRVVATGFRVIAETLDDQIDRDGLRNEVYAAFPTFHFRGGADYELLDEDMKRTKVHGDALKFPDRVRAGSASITGGLRQGDAFPADPTVRAGPLGDESFPITVWEGPLTDGADFQLVYPTLWEWGGSEASFDFWYTNLRAQKTAMWSTGKAGLTSDRIVAFGDMQTAAAPVKTWGDNFMDRLAAGFASMSFGALDFSARDRAIGLRGSPQGLRLPGNALLLTRRGIEGSLAAAGPGATRVALELPYVDEPTWTGGRGNYVLYVQVERVP